MNLPFGFQATIIRSYPINEPCFTSLLFFREDRNVIKTLRFLPQNCLTGGTTGSMGECIIGLSYEHGERDASLLTIRRCKSSRPLSGVRGGLLMKNLHKYHIVELHRK